MFVLLQLFAELLPTDVAINVGRPVLNFENMGFEAHFFLPFWYEGKL